MGKKASWFTALKRAFAPSSRDKPVIVTQVSEIKYVKEKKKWGFGRSKHGASNAFIPIYREPSSIEQILGDAERETHYKIHQEPPREKNPEPSRKNDQEPSRRNGQQPHRKKVQDPLKRKVEQSYTPAKKPIIASNKRGIAINYAQSSAIKIQAAYRGYMARKSYRALKGLVRLQRVMRGQSIKRQTTNTMRCMQLLVRVQSQVRVRRLQMMEGRGAQQHHTPRRSDNRDTENNLGRWSLAPHSEAEGGEEWDDSVLTKEEKDARTQRKVDAVIKRERALAYAYSHQLLKVTPKSAQAVLTDVRSGGFPWWWNWLERQLPHEPNHPKTPPPPTPKTTATATPRLRPASRGKPIVDASTPHSPKPFSSNRWRRAPPSRAGDDESLTSCPAYTAVPNYMTPTVSAKAKVRSQIASGSGGDGHDGKGRFSFSLTQSIGSLFAVKEPLPRRVPPVRGKHKSTSSIGGLSVDSTVSLPVGVGRKPFR